MRVSVINKKSIIKQVIIFSLFVCLGWYLKGRFIPQGAMMGAGAKGVTSVLTVMVEQANIAPKKEFIGKVEPINYVSLKPQVTGYVEEVLFQEGSLVNKGDLLFIIEQRKYIANIELRQAELDQAKANIVKVEKDYKRQVSLNKQKYASDAKLDIAKSDLLQAKALVKQANANLELAKINLDYTEIKAPITGYIGKALVTKGNYVSAATQDLAHIVQTNPIRVSFAVSDKDMLDMRSRYDGNDMNAPLHTEIVLPNGIVIENGLKSRFADNMIDANTATISIYAEYNNDKNLLIPGNYVDIRVGDAEEVYAILIPQASIVQDEFGAYVMSVNKEGNVEQKRVELGDVINDTQVVLSGLTADDNVIIQGLQKVRAGQAVKATLISNKAEAK